MNTLKNRYNERINLLEAPVAKKTRMSIMGIVKILRQMMEYIDNQDFPEVYKVMNIGIEKGIELTNQNDSFFNNLATESQSKQEHIIVSLATMPLSISDIIEQFMFSNEDIIKKIKKTGKDLSVKRGVGYSPGLSEKIISNSKNIIKNEIKIPDGFGKYTKKDNLFLRQINIEEFAKELIDAQIGDLEKLSVLIKKIGGMESKIEDSFSQISGEAPSSEPQKQNSVSGDGGTNSSSESGFSIQLQGDKLVLASSNGGPKVNISPQMITTFFMALMKADDSNIESTKSEIEKNIMDLAKTIRPKANQPKKNAVSGN